METYDPGLNIPHYAYTSAGDVYASGQVMWALMNLRRPTQYRYDADFGPKDLDASAKSFYPRRLQDLVMACIQPVPANRITAEQLWVDIRDEVGDFRGLRDPPLKSRGLPEDQVLNHKHDIYTKFVAA